ncbi:MAG: hypothetical protein QXI23_03985 [Candidatus Aenigmatarchaeota archaeon]
MRKKGINALEIVFAMFILIVVTLVVIRLFTTTVARKSLPNIDDFRAAYNYDIEKNKCNSLCSSYTGSACADLSAAVAFCQQKVSIDIDGNYRTGEKGHGGLIAGVPYCEDGLYCFHIAECGCGSYVLNAEQCLALMKDYYMNQIGLSKDVAEQIIVSKITPGQCDPDPVRWGKKFYEGYVPIKPSDYECMKYGKEPGCNLPADWWWWKAGYGEIARRVAVTGGVATSLTFDCVKEGKNVKCSWVGCPLMGEVVIFLSDGSFYRDENRPAGSYTFGPLEPGSYSAVLVCGEKTVTSESIILE